MDLEAINQEKVFEWWLGDDVRISIHNVDNEEEAIDKLGKFLLKVRSEKVNFNKH